MALGHKRDIAHAIPADLPLFRAVYQEAPRLVDDLGLLRANEMRSSRAGRSFDIYWDDLARFSQSPVYPSRNAFRDAEGFVGPFHPAFARSPLNHTGFSNKHSTDCSIAQIPQVGELSYGIMLLENRCQFQPVGRSSVG